MSDDIEFEIGSGNVFKDLGLSNPEERLAKAEIASDIIDVIVKKGLIEEVVSTILGIDKNRVSDLYQGRPSNFSIDQLNNFLKKFESIDIKVLK